MSKRFIIALCTASLLMGMLAFGVVETYRPIRPLLLCEGKLDDGQTLFRFGYENRSSKVLTVKSGEKNKLSEAFSAYEPPEIFLPGLQADKKKAPLDLILSKAELAKHPEIYWDIDGKRASLDETTPPCFPEKKPIDDILWVAPPPPPPPPPEAPKEEAPPPEENPPTPAPKKDPPKPAPKKDAPKPTAKKRAIQQKASDTPPSQAASDEPVALALTGLTNNKGGMAIQAGPNDSFGSAEVEATEATTARREGSAKVKKEVPREVKRTPAKVKVRPEGRWPDDAPKRLGQVVVRLSLQVGVDGKVKAVRLVKGAGEPFDGAAKKVGQKAIFDPAKEDDKSVESWVLWDVVFQPNTY